MSPHIFSQPRPADPAQDRAQAKSAKPGSAPQKEPTDFERQTLVGLYSAHKFAEAEALAQMLIERFPKHPLAWKVWGAILQQTDRLDQSLGPLQKAVALSPRDWQAHNNLGVALKNLGRIDEGIAAYRRAIALRADFAEAHGNLGDALRAKGLLQDALQSYRRKLALTPEDEDARFIAQVLSGEQVARPPAIHVKGVFDHYAATFDAHLVDQLGYQVPRQLHELIQASPLGSRQDLKVLDLGCGTGLVGQLIAPQAAELGGVDLSPNMLAQATQKNVYSRLVCADLVTMMQSEPAQHYDLIVAADVFIYVGQLDDVMAQAKRLLAPQGMLCFSIESVESVDSSKPADAAYLLQPSGRYAHSLHGLQALQQQHGFALIACQPTHLRMDQHQPVAGHLLAWQA